MSCLLEREGIEHVFIARLDILGSIVSFQGGPILKCRAVCSGMPLLSLVLVCVKGRGSFFHGIAGFHE